MIRPTFLELLLARLNLLPLPVADSFGSVITGMALAAAVRHRVPESLAEGPRPISRIARDTGLNPEAVRLLVETLGAQGYCRMSGEDVRLTAAGRKWLLRSSPHSVADLLRYVESRYRRWADLDHALLHGAPAVPYTDEFGPAEWEVYAAGMASLARILLPAVRRLVRLRPGDRVLLDLGGSHGLYAADCCARHPGLRATVVDYPGALEYGRRLAADRGDGGRVEFRAGDIRLYRHAEGADVVLLFNVVHGFDVETNRAMIRNLLASLRPGGRIYILDQFRGGRSRRGGGALIPLAVGLNLLNEIGGGSYSVEEVRGWAEGDGKLAVLRTRIPGVGMLEVEKRPPA
jgi:SAM-dependent methyltransferase